MILLKEIFYILLLLCIVRARVYSRPLQGSMGQKPPAELHQQSVSRQIPINGGATIPSPFTQSPRSLPAVTVDPNGKVYTTQILKQQLADELGLPLRDLRIVDPSFPSQIQATFMARPNVIIFCIENIKVVVQRNEALIFNPYDSSVQEFVPALQQQIMLAMNGHDENGNRNLLVNSARFEHIVIETALNVVCSSLLKRVRALRPAVSKALQGLRAESRGLDVVQTQVDELLPLKNKLDVLRKRVREVKRAITDTLNNDEDMSMMQLGSPFLYKESKHSGSNQDFAVDYTDGSQFGGEGTPLLGDTNSQAAGMYHPTSDDEDDDDVSEKQYLATMNMEMLFESYLNEVEWISAEVEDEIDEITNTEENLVLQLDLLRNRLLRFELMLSISSFVITCGALITGLFGMNLLSHIEFHKSAFYIVTGLMISGMISAFLAFNRYARRQKLF
jgi:magnesium transporter